MKNCRFTWVTMAAVLAMAAPLAMAAGAVVVPAPDVVTQSHGQQAADKHRLSTAQMYRDYMETGSIYYSDSARSGPPVHRVSMTNRPLLQAIETEAAKMAQPPRSQKTPTVQVASNK